MVFDDGHFPIHQALDVFHVFSLVGLIDQRPGDAAGAGAASSADAVHVRLRNVGDLEVDDVAHARDVDAAGGDVRSDEDVQLPRPEGLHGSVALGLGLVAVDGLGLDLVALQVADDLVCAVFGAGENQGRFNLLLLQQVHQEFAFIVLIHEKHVLVHGVSGGALLCYLNALGILEHGAGELQNIRRHRG